MALLRHLIALLTAARTAKEAGCWRLAPRLVLRSHQTPLILLPPALAPLPRSQDQPPAQPPRRISTAALAQATPQAPTSGKQGP